VIEAAIRNIALKGVSNGMQNSMYPTAANNHPFKQSVSYGTWRFITIFTKAAP
jgi:hypothetical protein